MGTLFGEAVVALRTRKKISQVELADKLALSKQYVCGLERGRKTMSIKQAARFAEALGEPPLELVAAVIQDDLNQAGLNYQVILQFESRPAVFKPISIGVSASGLPADFDSA